MKCFISFFFNSSLYSRILHCLSLEIKSQSREAAGFPPLDRPCHGSIKPLTLSRFHIAHPLRATASFLTILMGKRDRARKRMVRRGRTRDDRAGRKISEFCQWPLGHGSVESGERLCENVSPLALTSRGIAACAEIRTVNWSSWNADRGRFTCEEKATRWRKRIRFQPPSGSCRRLATSYVRVYIPTSRNVKSNIRSVPLVKLRSFPNEEDTVSVSPV